MPSINGSKWYQNYEALKAYILERGHLPDKHVVENRALLLEALYGVPYWWGKKEAQSQYLLNLSLAQCLEDGEDLYERDGAIEECL